jgi:hypothetical protein
MAFIGSIQVIYLDGTTETVRPTLADELEWSKQTKKSIQQYQDLTIYDLSVLVHQFLKRTEQIDEDMLEWAKDVDALMPVGDIPKAMSAGQ